VSRAFTRDPDGTDAAEELPDLPVSPDRNLVTASGLALIEAEIAKHAAAQSAALAADDKTALARARRDLRYWAARRESAELVPAAPDTDEMRFGLLAVLEDGSGAVKRYRVVGQDEADPARGLISYTSPLARALIGKAVGDNVQIGQNEAEITAIEF
jgi:transcription elongation GreA/GreB family factor